MGELPLGAAAFLGLALTLGEKALLLLCGLRHAAVQLERARDPDQQGLLLVGERGAMTPAGEQPGRRIAGQAGG